MIKNGIELDNFKEITDVDFSNDNPHLALVHKDQGGSANGWHKSLLTKSDLSDMKEDVMKALEQITVTLSFEEFLRKFFDMWYSDAEMLTKLLGYQTEDEYYEEQYKLEDGLYDHKSYLEEKLDKFQLLKSAKVAGDIPKEDFLAVLAIQQSFEKGVKQFDITFEEKDAPSEGVAKVVKSIAEDPSDPSDKSNVIKNKEDPLKIEDLLKSAEGVEFLAKMKAELEESGKAELVKAKEAVVAAEEAGKAELAKASEELVKASEELVGFREEKEAMRKEGYVGLVKSLSFVAEGADADVLVGELLKGSKAEAMDMKVIVAQLEAAQEAVAKAKQDFVDSEAGVEVKDEVKDVAKATELADSLAAKYAGKKFLD